VAGHHNHVLKYVMDRLKQLSIITIAVLAVMVGLLLAVGIGSLSFPWSGPLGAALGLLCFGLLIRAWAK
jgi:hypothetical protein